MIPELPDTKVALKGTIVGIANKSIDCPGGGAKAFRALGADLAVTYPNERSRQHVGPLARALKSPIFMPLDVMVERIAKERGQLNFLLHSIAFSPRETLHGPVVNVGRDGFLKTRDV